MSEASRLLDGDLTPEELTTLLERLKHDAAFRDEVSAQQLIRDSLMGIRSLDDGYTLRILVRLRSSQAGAAVPPVVIPDAPSGAEGP